MEDGWDMKPEPKEKWTVSSREVNGKESRNYNKHRPTYTEHWLCYEGCKCHVLTGHNGHRLLSELSKKYNGEGYEPQFRSGKPWLDLSEKKRLELAFKGTMPLPFDQEAKS